MESMEEEDQQKYEAHFAKYIANDIGPDEIEDMYKDAHAKIRESPEFEAKPKKTVTNKRSGNKVFDGKTTYVRSIKKTKSERFATVATKIQNHAKRVLAAMDDDSD